MALFEIVEKSLLRRDPATYASLNLYEREDLQALLRDQPSALGEELLIIAEEYGNWEDARRRIDLLALDRQGHLVVIELKRTEDGGHMELQALRYAAMISSMTFEEVETAFTALRAKQPAQDDVDPRSELFDFLGASDEDEAPAISTDVRIILVSADFGREITTAVLWLNRFDGMDIRCVRAVPYSLEGRVLLDIQQVIPLPEAGDYQVRIRRKDIARERAATSDGRDLTRFQIITPDGTTEPLQKRQAIRTMITELSERGASLAGMRELLPNRALKVIPDAVTEPEEVVKRLLDQEPSLDVGRYFTEFPLVDQQDGHTYIVWKMWGRRTEEWLKKLAEQFGHGAVSFKRAGETQ